MSTYVVKIGDNRNIFIEADFYRLEANTATYHFYNRSSVDKKAPILVGSISAHQALGVIEFDKVYGDNFFVFGNELDEEERDCPCDPPVEPCPVPGTATAVPDPEPQRVYPSLIEHWIDQYDREWYGFHTPKGFVNFSTKASAELGRSDYLKGYTNWVYLDLTGRKRLD